MKLFIVTYTHRHGADVWPRFVADDAPAPSAGAEIDELEDWEGEERGEFLEISGPFHVPPPGSIG